MDTYIRYYITDIALHSMTNVNQMRKMSKEDMVNAFAPKTDKLMLFVSVWYIFCFSSRFSIRNLSLPFERVKWYQLHAALAILNKITRTKMCSTFKSSFYSRFNERYKCHKLAPPQKCLSDFIERALSTLIKTPNTSPSK